MEMGGHTEQCDDWSGGRLDEHKRMRDSQVQVFGRICCFKPMKAHLLQMVVNLFDGLNPQTSKPNDVEVPICMMINLSVELTTQQKNMQNEDSRDYFQLISYILGKDMLNNYPCLNNPYCLEEYMQMVYRWSFFFTGDQLFQLIAHVFFNERTIFNQNPQVVKSTC